MKKTLLMQAPAKINIGLWVKEKRPDGFHEIVSVMQTISLSDNLTLHETKEDGIYLECTHPGVPAGPENLAHRATRMILEHFQVAPNVAIKIEKNIPVAAGLAGGSSDAAAVIHGLARLYDRPLPIFDLMTLSQQIGSDVPFVMHGGLALATGRGEKLQFFEAPRPSLAVVIAVPRGLEVSTKWAYENFRPGENARKEERFQRILPAYRARDLQELRSVVFNDLESVTLHRHPEIAAIKEILDESREGVVLMSGSGPSVFGLFADKKKAVQAASRLDPDKVDIFVEHTTRAVNR